MPTSADFDLAAAYFDQVAAELENILGPAAALLGRDTISGGQLGLVVDATIDRTTNTLEAVANALRDDAYLCRTRADACRSYASSFAAYETELKAWSTHGDFSNPMPTKPPKPGPWVEL